MFRVPTEEELWDCELLGWGAHGAVFSWGANYVVKVGSIPRESARAQRFAYKHGYGLPVLFHAENAFVAPTWFCCDDNGTMLSGVGECVCGRTLDVLITYRAEPLDLEEYKKLQESGLMYQRAHELGKALDFSTFDLVDYFNIMKWRGEYVFIDFGLPNDWWYDRDLIEDVSDFISWFK